MAGVFDGGMGAATVGGGISYHMAEKSADYAKKNAREQRAWAERMSNTQYQRTMHDMRLAGLNPILAYRQGGAGVPSGATATTPDFAGAVTAGMGTGSKVAANKAEINFKKKQETLTSAKTAESVDAAARERTQAGLNNQLSEESKGRVWLNEQQANLVVQNAFEVETRRKLLETQMPAAQARMKFDNTTEGAQLIQFNRAAGMIPGLNLFNAKNWTSDSGRK